MSERAVFLDRDNTIIENDGYLGDPSKVKLLPGAATALSAMRALGYRLVVVSNQSGVARGHFDEAAVEAVNTEMSRQLKQQAGAYIDASYYCPYHPEAPRQEYRVDHDWRKPKGGMLKQAAVDFKLDLAQCWMIGDQGRDVGAGVSAGCRTILLKNADLSSAKEPEADKMPSPNFVVRTLADAARVIAREGRQHPQPPAPPPPPPAPAPSPPPAPAAAPQPAAPAEPPAPPAPDINPAAPDGSPGLSLAPTMDVSSPTTPAAVEPLPSAPRPAPSFEAPAPPQPSAPPPTPLAMSSSLSRLERTLDELVLQLRAQSHHADLKPDFSYIDMLMLIVQIAAVVTFLLGLHAYFTAPASFDRNEYKDFFNAQSAHETAMIWLLAGVVLQGMVIAILLRKRRQ